MKIQLSKIISVPKYEETVEASIDLNEIKLKGVSYPIREKNDFSIVFRNIGKDKISFAFETEVTLGIPCSRCLEEVSYPVSVQVTKELDFSDLDEEDSSYIEDKYLDLDILIFDEVVPKLPSRVLCKEDCKGLCPVCVKPMSICPKNKSSKGRRNRRRANWKMTAPTLVKCSKCGALMMPHRVCKACGSYNKKEIVSAHAE